MVSPPRWFAKYTAAVLAGQHFINDGDVLADLAAAHDTDTEREGYLPARLSDAALKAALAPVQALGAVARVPLALATPDSNPAVTHPMVIDTVAEAGAPWNGYRYWMAYTPYPDSTRENPCIAASHNGADWITPAGVTNPVAPLAAAVAAGLEFQSDPCLALVNGTMHLFYRAYRNSATLREVMYLRTSTDGFKTVSAPTALLDLSGNNNVTLSPAFVREADGTWSVWTVDDTVTGSARLKRRTLSADFSTMSAPSACTVPAAATDIWHIEVRKTVDGRYHMLAPTKNKWGLIYWTSTDGLTWTGGPRGRVPKSGLSYDTRGFYKSSFIPKAGSPYLFDLWVTGLDNTGADAWGDQHKIAFRPNVDLAGGSPLNVDDRIWIPAPKILSPGLGTPAETLITSRYPTLGYDSTSGEGATCMVMFPSSWISAKVTLYWANLGTGTGGVTWQLATQPVLPGQDLVPAASEISTLQAATAGTQNRVVDTVIAVPLSIDSNALYEIRVNRIPTDAGDTLANDAGLVGILLERTA
jgi:hypothetical protein